MSGGNPLAGFRRAMRHADYRAYTIGSVTSLVGTWVHRVALGWLTWDLTHSYGWLGIMSFAALFSMMAFSPVAGDLSDRMDRLRLSRWAQFAMMCQAAAIVVLVFTGLIDIWSLLALTVALGIMQSFHTASRLALVPNLVPPEDLTPAIAINSMIFNVARFIGPAIAGAIIAVFGVGLAFLFNVLSFIVFLAVLMRIRMMRDENPPGARSGMIRNITDGVRYAAGHPGIGPMLLMLSLTAFAGRALPDLLPGFADGVYGRGAEGLAWMTSSMGLGASLSGFYFLTRDGVDGITRVVIANVLLMSGATIAFAMAGAFWGAVALLAVIGFAMNNAGIGTLNLMQNAVDGRMRGRVMSIYTFIYQGAPALGTVVIGAVADRTELAWPVVGTGAVALLSGVVMLPRLARVRGALEAVPASVLKESRP